jgi:hypothetical protein
MLAGQRTAAIAAMEAAHSNARSSHDRAGACEPAFAHTHIPRPPMPYAAASKMAQLPQFCAPLHFSRYDALNAAPDPFWVPRELQPHTLADHQQPQLMASVHYFAEFAQRRH